MTAVSFVPDHGLLTQWLVDAGLLYPAGDLEAAAEATRKLMADPAAAAEMGRAGRAEVERWGWSAATARLRGIQYRAAIAAYHGKHMCES